MRPLALLCLCLSVFYSASAQNVAVTTFAEGNISTDVIEYGITFSENMDELYFARSNGRWGKGSLTSTIYYSQKVNGRWSNPAVASFSGEFDDAEPHLSIDGNTLYFISSRPNGKAKPSADIWRVTRNGNRDWGQPERLGDHINSEGTEYSPRTSANGNLYFASTRAGGYGQGDLYMVENRGGNFSHPINLGPIVNSPTGEWNLEISRDEKVLVFEASGRPQNVTGYGDLYISFKDGGRWTVPQNIKELNSGGSDLYPEIAAQGKELYFASSKELKNEWVNIYKVDFEALRRSYEQFATSSTPYLFVANRSGHEVAVVNLDTEKVIKKIPVGKGPHEISLSKDGNFISVANYGSFPKPHKGPIKSNELKWMNEKQQSATIISTNDFKSRELTMANSQAMHGVLTNADGSIIWLTAEEEGVVKEVEVKTGNLLHSYKTMKGSHVLRSTSDYSRIYASNIESNTISMIDTKTKEVVHLETPDGPEGLELSPDGSELWVLSNGANMVTVLNATTLEKIADFPSKGRFPVKLTFTNHEAWVANVFSRNISVFDAITKEFKREIILETTPLSIFAYAGKVYVTLPRKNLIKVFDAVSKAEVSEFSPGIEPDGMQVLEDLDGRLKEQLGE